MKQIPLIAPSILAADFGKLADEIEMINQSDADWIHCDIMDGMFVPNISFGLPVLASVQKVAQKPLDVHLMIEKPERYIHAFRDVGAAHLTVHYEASVHLDRTIHAIREAGMKPGVALNPSTGVEVLRHILPLVDIVLLMSVNPGFGGQKFIPYTLDKIIQLRHLMAETNTTAHIEIDGGVDNQTAPGILRAGADVLVAGSYVFRAEDQAERISGLKKLSDSSIS